VATGGAEDESITLRDVTDGDEAFLRQVYASTRAAEMALVDWPESVKDAFVRQQFDAQRSWYRQTMPDATYQVILLGGRPVGRLYLDRRPDETCLVDIAILPAFQHRGAGSWLLDRILGEAAARRASVSLHVEINNPARTWYLRRGFAVDAEEGAYLRMRWRSPEPSKDGPP
jgi:ribosomal protein S18 acetylase RimI-like enzyme